MSVPAVRPAALRAPGPRTAVCAAVRSDGAVLTVVLVWTAVLAALTWGRWGDPTMDTGYDLLAAARVAHGELPFTDFIYYYGPLGPLVLGGIYAVFGTALWSAVALGLGLSVAAVVLTFRLAREFVVPAPAGLAAALTASSAMSSANNSYVLPHSTSAPLALVLLLVALLQLVRWERRGATERWRLAAAGACCGLVAVTRPETAVALFGGVAIWLALGFRGASRAERRTVLRAVAAPALAVPAAVYGAFLTSVSPHELVLENLYPREYLQQAGNVVLRAHAPWTASSVAELGVRAVAYGAGIGVLLVAARLLERRGSARRLVVVGAVLCAFAVLALLGDRPDTLRAYLKWPWMWLPAGVWLALVLVALRAIGNAPAALLCAVLAILATMTYASFTPFPNALHPDASAYLMPLAAVFLVWLHTAVLGGGRAPVAALGATWIAILLVANAGLIVHDARQETSTIDGPHGSMTARSADGPALQAALNAVVERTRPGDDVLLAPQLTSLYVLTDRRDPLRQLSLLPGTLAGPSDEASAISRMSEVRLAVIDDTPQTTYSHGAFGVTFDRRLAAWLRRDFHRTATVSGTGAGARKLDIWERRR